MTSSCTSTSADAAAGRQGAASAPVGAAPGAGYPQCPGAVVVVVELALTLRGGGNAREHWAARRRRVARERAAVAAALHGRVAPLMPCTVTLARVGWNLLDGDNLQGVFKSVRDQVADWLRVNDRDPLVTWGYEQATTRARRLVRNGMGHGRWEADSRVRITIEHRRGMVAPPVQRRRRRAKP